MSLKEMSEIKDLSLFQRVLLITDGTVTELLEQYTSELIKVVKLYENITDLSELPHLHKSLVCLEKSKFLKRKTLLQGQTSLKNWLYAESTIILDNLDINFRNDLLNSNEPIGKLWFKYRSETYKVIIDVRCTPAKKLAPYFDLLSDDKMIVKTYTVYSGNNIIMVITERFPYQFFRGKNNDAIR